ncbi:Zinc-binding dehydrogenase family protein 1 [Cupriavidus taiwanensis]|uniref:NADPH:quinone oxidoreductase family protein n=1 Tax=Cupriavidus taiwanensis TaxID=164546 RepID=UPI000E14BF84|nr:NADPH:quinone oxidoreductase family protein [Cupriavidus taiwanensis]SOZ18277.1 Zinc-binding dehydrogenase family protein 1 [Cupriavidus taiwanensis]SOZ31239.1 Zinc-binding dehydrogenase family protein 1 [Cupriavidus taiwanensis]SOZ47316.1 Zinc-binding dehydrogenase family protein 1 [Cupriavidus taiwanensis]
MKAVVCRQLGLDNTELADVVPQPLRSDGVRIRVHAAGVSFANLLVLEGKHQNRWEPPFTPGTEVAGVVMECGDRATLFKAGDRVVAGVRIGGYAEEVIAPESTVFALPDAVSFDAAVQFPTIYATAYGALKWRAKLAQGETLLVHGAAGGSGLAAVEIGKILGARVIATAGDAAKLEAARRHGADVAINYRTENFRDVVLRETDGRGADVIFDPVGGETFNESLRCIAPDGRIIPMGFAGGTIPQIPANLVLVKNVSVIGIYWGYYMGWGKQLPPPDMKDRVRNAFAEMLGWAAAGKLNPETYATFPLPAFRDALSAISERKVIGRVVLHPSTAS